MQQCGCITPWQMPYNKMSNYSVCQEHKSDTLNNPGNCGWNSEQHLCARLNLTEKKDDALTVKLILKNGQGHIFNN
jgi:hypothetical protein